MVNIGGSMYNKKGKIIFLPIIIFIMTVLSLQTFSRPGLSGRGRSRKGITSNQISIMNTKLAECQEIANKRTAYRGVVASYKKRWRMILKGMVGARQRREYSKLLSHVNGFISRYGGNVPSTPAVDKVSNRELSMLSRKIKLAERLMRKKNAIRYRNNIRNQRRRYNSIRRLRRRNKHKRARKVYDTALSRINYIIKVLRKIENKRKITNSREASNPRSERKFTIYLEKKLKGYRNRHDRIRRRQRADYTFNVRTRRYNVYRAYVRLRAKPKNNKNFVVRIKVNGRRVFQEEIKRFTPKRWRYKTIKIPDNVIRNGKNTIRVVVVKPYNNFYLDIDKIYLRVYAKR